MSREEPKPVGDNPIFDEKTGLPPTLWQLKPVYLDRTASDPFPDFFKWAPVFSKKEKKRFDIESPEKKTPASRFPPLRQDKRYGFIPIYDRTMTDPNPSPEGWVPDPDLFPRSIKSTQFDDFVTPTSGSSFESPSPSSSTSAPSSPFVTHLNLKTGLIPSTSPNSTYMKPATKKRVYPIKKLNFDTPSKKRKNVRNDEDGSDTEEIERKEEEENSTSEKVKLLEAKNVDITSFSLRKDDSVTPNFIAITPRSKKIYTTGYKESYGDFSSYKGVSPIKARKRFGNYRGYSPTTATKKFPGYDGYSPTTATRKFPGYDGYSPARAPRKKRDSDDEESKVDQLNTPEKYFSPAPFTPVEVNDTFVVSPVRRLLSNSNVPQLSPSKRVLVQELKRGFVETFPKQGDTDFLRHFFMILQRNKVKQLRTNKKSHYDVVPSDLPLSPRLEFFLQHVDLYYINDSQWILPGHSFPFWVSHPNFVLQDLVRPSFDYFLSYLGKLDPKLDVFSPENNKNTTTPLKSSVISSPMTDDFTIEGKSSTSIPLKEKYTSVLKTNLKGSSCVFFNDCYKTVVRFEDKITQHSKALVDSDQSFSLILLSDNVKSGEENTTEVWGIRLPKTCKDVKLKRKSTMQEIPHLEMGSGITMRNAELSVVLTTEGEDLVKSSLEKGDIYKNENGKLSMLEKNWKNQLNKAGGENDMRINQVNKKSETAVIHIKGVQENDKWIIFKKSISTMQDKNFILSFTVPYVPSKAVPVRDNFKNKAWFFHHAYVIGNTNMMESVHFHPNAALCRKTLALNFGSIFLKNAYGISIAQDGVFVPKSITAGDSDTSDENVFTENEVRSFSQETLAAPPPSSSVYGSRTKKRTSEVGYESRQADSMQRVQVEEGSFVSKDTPVTCFIDSRDTKSGVIHYVVISNSDLPTPNDVILRSIVKPFKTMLSITVVENENKRTLSSDDSRLTVYTEEGLEFKTINSLKIQEGEPLLMDLDLTDNSVVLRDFNTSRTSNPEITQTISTLTCTACIKVRKGSCEGGVTLIYDGRQDISTTKLMEWKDFQTYMENNLSTEDDKPSVAFFNSKRRELDNEPKILHLNVEELLKWKEGETVKTLDIPLKFVNKN